MCHIVSNQAIDDFAFSSKKYRHLLLSEEDWNSIEALNSVLEVRAYLLCFMHD